jgi:hypothetical protein
MGFYFFYEEQSPQFFTITERIYSLLHQFWYEGRFRVSAMKSGLRNEE